jgi:alpha-tubulin suppressor-like RCC1 family protein
VPTNPPWTGVQTHYAFAGGLRHFSQIQADEVFGWGANSFGQLGLGDNTNKPTPQSVPLAPALSGSPVSVCSGYYFSCVLDSNKDVACTGRDDEGQQGVGATAADTNLLTIPSGVSSVVHLACGSHSVLVTTTTGSLMAWGFNPSGGLGLPPVTAVDKYRLWEAQVSCLLFL